MSEFWDVVLDWHARVGSPVAALPRETHDVGAVLSRLGGAGVTPDDDLARFFASGVLVPADQPSFLFDVYPGFRYPGLRYFVESLDYHRSGATEAGSPPWRADWFPLMKDPSSGLVVVGADDGWVWQYSGTSEHLVFPVGESLGSFGRRLVGVLEAAGYQWDAEYGLDSRTPVDVLGELDLS